MFIWTFCRTMLGKEKANQPTEDNSAPLLNSTNRQPTLSLLSQLKQHNKPDKFNPAVHSESISSDTILKAWESRNQPSHKSISTTQLHDAESLQSVLQNFSLAKNENTDSKKNKYSDSMLVSSTFYHSTEGPQTTCLTPNMTQVQADCISSSWELPQGGPLGEILTNSKNNDDSNKKCESRSYGWLLNLDHSPWFLNLWRAWHRYLTMKATQKQRLRWPWYLSHACSLFFYFRFVVFS